ncbi:MAG: SRPBCC family protein, partial [Acidimicrobiales bacterium]
GLLLSDWPAKTDFGAISDWAPDVDHSCLLTEGHTGVGTTRRIQAGRITLLETITRWDPGLSLAYTIEGLPTVRLVKNEWQLDPVAAGTLVSLITRIEPGPKPVHKLVAKALSRKLTGASKQMLSGLEKATS